jgi:hypothetical protein
MVCLLTAITLKPGGSSTVFTHQQYTEQHNVFVNSNWVDTWWQQYSTHLHTNSKQHNTMKQNTQNGTYITIRIHNLQNQTAAYKT